MCRNMKIRFWQKTYIWTLVLFLVCLYVGLFSLAYYTYNRSVDNAEKACRAEADYIAMSFERDYNSMTAAGSGGSPSLLMQSYGQNYAKQQIMLDFTENGERIYTSFAALTDYPAAGTLTQMNIGGSRHILISSGICDGKYALVYGKYAADLDDEFKSLMTTYAVVALGVSIFLALTLLFVLKKLSVPLEKLRTTTETISGGDMTVLADESGKDEFSTLAKSFNIMVATVKSQMDKLTEDAECKQMLVDNMAHEMRTPLTSIRGYAEYIEKAAVPEEERNDAAKRIVSETDRLRKISERLLDTAFMRENTIKIESVDLAKLLDDIKEKLSQKAKKCNVTVNIEAFESIVQGDETLLSMLFYNLTENAIKACQSGGIVTLYCNGYEASVTDNGKGMTAEQLSHITEPFYRTDKSRSRAEGGAGLGLALCKQIVESHKAEMRFESEVGKGTKIFLNFTTPRQLGD